MEHTYLSENVIKEALKRHFITKKEAKKLKKRVDYQSSIIKIVNKEVQP